MAFNRTVDQDKPPDPSQNNEQTHANFIHDPQKQNPEKTKGISNTVDDIHSSGFNHPLPAINTGALGTNKSPATVIHQHPTSNIIASNGLFPKVSANFDRPGTSIQNLQQKFKGIAPVRQNGPMNSQMEKLKVSPPLPHSVKPTFANTLRSIHEQSVPRIELSPTKQTTKQGFPAVIFKRDDYLVKLAARCKFTLIGKFESTMPRMEVIRKSFEAQVQLKGSVKITHFNSNHVYIDLTNQLDHDMVWFKEKIWIQGRQMKLFVWTPTFKPNEETPIVPIWVVLPELPWHMYYLEAISELLLSVGRAISLDTATFQKTRGSVAKVKLEIDVSKSRPKYLWVGYDEDENGEGYWQEVQYENVPDYCFQCKHQGHSINVCPVKKREDLMANKDGNDKDEVSGVQKNFTHKNPTLSVQHRTVHHTNVIDINVHHKKNNHRDKPPPKQQYVAKDPINNTVRKEELGTGAPGKPHALMEIQHPVVACTEGMHEAHPTQQYFTEGSQFPIEVAQQSNNLDVTVSGRVKENRVENERCTVYQKQVLSHDVAQVLVNSTDIAVLTESGVGVDTTTRHATALDGVSSHACPAADATGSGKVTGNVLPAATNNAISSSVKHFPDVVHSVPAVMVDQQINADSVKTDNGGGVTQTDAAFENLDTVKQGQKSLLSENAFALLSDKCDQINNAPITEQSGKNNAIVVELQTETVATPKESTKSWVERSFAKFSSHEEHPLVASTDKNEPVNQQFMTNLTQPNEAPSKANLLLSPQNTPPAGKQSKNTSTSAKKARKKHQKKTDTAAEKGITGEATQVEQQQSEEEVRKAKIRAWQDAILAKSYAEIPMIESNIEPLNVLENKATQSVPSQDSFDPTNAITMGRDNDEIESNKALTAYVSPAHSGNTLIPTATLEVMCKQASKVMKEVGRGFFPVTPQDQIDTETQEAPIYYLGDLFEESQKDQNETSKQVKSKWNLDAPLFIPNALRHQNPQVPVESVDSQDASDLESPTGPSDEVLLQSMDLHDIRGLLHRQNSPPHDLPQKFSSPHPGIIEDGSEYEDEDAESTAHNKMAEARYAGLSPRVEQACKPKLIKKKRRPLELKKKEAAPKKPKRVQPTRSSKSRSSRRK